MYNRLQLQEKIGSVTIKNRIVMPAMMLGHGQFDGTPTEQMMAYYEERAKGGVGLIISEIARVDDMHGVGAFAQLAVSKDYHVEPLKEMVSRIHRHGCKFFVQLHHPGYQAEPLTAGLLPISIGIERILPAYRNLFYTVAPLVRNLAEKGLVLPVVGPSKTEPSTFTNAKTREMKIREIEKLQKQFVEGAIRSKKSGADGVELHAAHGYLLQQFLSPRTNHREDQYGGSLDNRMRLILTIIDGIRQACGEDFVITVRLSLDEFYDRIGKPGIGYDLAEGIRIAKRLEASGIDAINVSSANYETMNYWLEPTSFEPGWRSYLAKAVKDAVQIPVIAANYIRSPKQAEEQLALGLQDFVALGRPLIADPYWAAKALEGKEEKIRRCIGCLWCFESMYENAYDGKAGECAVNPFMGHEQALRDLPVNGDARKVVIVGGGPAGMTVAEILKLRGFDITLIEAGDSLGGQLCLADKPPLKDKIGWYAKDQEKRLRDLGVNVTLNTFATPECIQSIEPDIVIVATGGKAVLPLSIPGADQNHVTTTDDILLRDTLPSGKKIAVIGSGMTGLETAEALAKSGNEVTIVEMSEKLSPNTFIQHIADIVPRLESYGTQMQIGQQLIEIKPSEIVLKSVSTAEITSLSVDLVVMAVGVKSENKLYEMLNGKIGHLYLIGDASSVGRIGHATRSAYDIGMQQEL